jgi:membrane-bound serine protease (ClpP class)
MKAIRRMLGLSLILFASFSLVFQPVQAQTDDPLVLVMTADGPIMPPMFEYFKRGIESADRQGAEVLIIQLNTPGGSVETMLEIISEIRTSDVPVVVYVAPRNAIAGSAGAMITMAGHASARRLRRSLAHPAPSAVPGRIYHQMHGQKPPMPSKLRSVHL